MISKIKELVDKPDELQKYVDSLPTEELAEPYVSLLFWGDGRHVDIIYSIFVRIVEGYEVDANKSINELKQFWALAGGVMLMNRGLFDKIMVDLDLAAPLQAKLDKLYGVMLKSLDKQMHTKKASR